MVSATHPHVPSPVDIGYAAAEDLTWRSVDKPVETSRPFRVVCIGAGVSGIYAGIRIIRSLSNVDLTIYDKNADFGGTWFENRYLGCACDIPAHCYQFSFEPNPDWSSFYAPAAEIGAYWKRVAVKYGLQEYTKFNSTIISSKWNEEEGLWHLEVEDLYKPGTVYKDKANVVIQAVGGLNKWKWPEIPNLHNFEGLLVHSAVWDEEYRFEGKKVALVGSGSTAIQMLPHLAKLASQVDQFVRSSTWIGFPFASEEFKTDEEGDDPTNHFYTAKERTDFKNNAQLSQRYRHKLMTNLNSIHSVTMQTSELQQIAQKEFWKNMKTKLASKPEIAKFLKPDFPVGCRRLTPGPQYLETLVQDHVGFITDSIAEVTPAGIKGSSGKLREYDAIVCATGFDTSYKPRFPIYGKDGQDLAKRWELFPETYCSVAVDGFPNYFLANGPNSAVGSGDLLILLQTEIDYAVQCIRKLQTQGYKSMSVKREALKEFQQYSQTYFKKTVFGTECRTWYKSGRSTGPVTALWPGSSLHAVKTLLEPRWEDYDFELLYGPNRFDYLGNGFTSAEQIEGADTAWYVTVPDPELVTRVGQAAAAVLLPNLNSDTSRH